MWAMHSTRATAAHTLIAPVLSNYRADVGISLASGERCRLIFCAATDPDTAGIEREDQIHFLGAHCCRVEVPVNPVGICQ